MSTQNPSDPMQQFNQQHTSVPVSHLDYLCQMMGQSMEHQQMNTHAILTAIQQQDSGKKQLQDMIDSLNQQISSLTNECNRLAQEVKVQQDKIKEQEQIIQRFEKQNIQSSSSNVEPTPQPFSFSMSFDKKEQFVQEEPNVKLEARPFVPSNQQFAKPSPQQPIQEDVVMKESGKKQALPFTPTGQSFQQVEPRVSEPHVEKPIKKVDSLLTKLEALESDVKKWSTKASTSPSDIDEFTLITKRALSSIIQGKTKKDDVWNKLNKWVVKRSLPSIDEKFKTEFNLLLGNMEAILPGRLSNEMFVWLSPQKHDEGFTVPSDWNIVNRRRQRRRNCGEDKTWEKYVCVWPGVKKGSELVRCVEMEKCTIMERK